jgi:uncharacterized RDD family membrane protein YckC
MNEILDDENIRKHSPENVRFASFWTRVAASLLDSIVLMPILLLGVYNMMTWKNLPLYFLLQIAAMVYKPLMEAEKGATLGKMATKIKVVTTDYKDIDLQQSLSRYAFYFANSFMGLIGGFMIFLQEEFAETSDFYAIAELQAKIGTPEIDQFLGLLVFVSCIFCTADPLKQTLHDKMAKTYVVNAEDLK